MILAWASPFKIVIIDDRINNFSTNNKCNGVHSNRRHVQFMLI